ncbi:MAG: SulP family inorganic anion transporter [Terracidiphilus sp.]
MKIQQEWLPRSILCLRSYTLQQFTHDLVAGITVCLVALPLAMAFGIASGVTPQAGLYTAVVAGFLISALGGSRTQIGGPTGAFVVIVAGIIAKFGVSGLSLVTLIAGALLVVMGATGLGAAVKFIPRAGDYWLHQRHRAIDCLHAGERFPRTPHRAGSKRLSEED